MDNVSPTTIPLVDLKAQLRTIRTDVNAAILRILDRGDFILGEDVLLFEKEFAEYCGVSHAVGVANGTDALQLACRALNVGEGDEVIIPAMTFASTGLGVLVAGARPVFVDVRADDALMDPTKIEAVITRRTKAIIPVHLYGQCADMVAIGEIAKRYSLAIIEDAAQAHGAVYRGQRAGSFGDVACFSFYPGKNLGAYGDAGLVATGRVDVAKRLESLRNCGARIKYHHDDVGLNSRLDTLQAAILRVKLRHLDGWNKARRHVATLYDAALEPLGEIGRTAYSAGSVYHLYVVKISGRDEAVKMINSRGIGSGIHYPFALHELNAFRSLGYKQGAFPVAEDWARRCLSLPMYAELAPLGVESAVDALKYTVAQIGSH